jgi:hypothetical protein
MDTGGRDIGAVVELEFLKEENRGEDAVVKLRHAARCCEMRMDRWISFSIPMESS